MPADLTGITVTRSRLTVQGLRDRVRGDLALRGSNRITDADIDAWGNECQDTIGRETGWYKLDLAGDTTAGTKEYQPPAQFTAIEEIWHNNLPLVLTTLRELSAYDPYWRSAGQATPLFWYTDHSASLIGFHPTPVVTQTGILHFYGRGLPPYPSGPQDQYYIPFGSDEALVVYCKMLASEKDASGEGERRWSMYNQRWTAALERIKRQVIEFTEEDVTIFGEHADLGRWPGHRFDYEAGTPISKPGYLG